MMSGSKCFEFIFKFKQIKLIKGISLNSSPVMIYTIKGTIIVFVHINVDNVK